MPRFQRNKKARCLRHTGPETPCEGCRWPGVTSARDTARADSPTDRRIVSLLANAGCDADVRQTRTTSVQGVFQADSTRGHPHGTPFVLCSYRRITPGGCSRDSGGKCGTVTSKKSCVGFPDAYFPTSHKGSRAAIRSVASPAFRCPPGSARSVPRRRPCHKLNRER
jgi:hypothetical protein